jgi:hypothetical protein
MPDHSPLPWKKLPGNYGAWSAIIEDAEGHDVVEQIKTDDAELIVRMVNFDMDSERDRLFRAFSSGWEHAREFSKRYKPDPTIPDDGYAVEQSFRRCWEDFASDLPDA